MRQTPLLGVGLTLAAAALWGTTGTAQSFAPMQTSPYWVGALRLVVASLFFAAYAAASARPGRPDAGIAWPRSAWPPTAIAGACIAAYNLTFFAGVKATGIALGTALAIGSGPVWAGLLQAVVLRQRPAPAWWLGTMLAVGGGGLMLSSGGGAGRVDIVGVILCLSAGLAYACYTLISQSLVSRVSPTRLTLRTFSVAAVIAVPAAWIVSGVFAAAPAGWWVVGYLGVFATGISYLLFSHALRHISGPTAVTLAMGEPITAFVLAVVVVGERPAAQAFCGLGLVVGGLAVVVWAEALRAPRAGASRATTARTEA
jgi:drug/metabolite transporter, DME family